MIQEFEALFRGAGWNVIKVIWGRTWDELLAKDVDGVLLNKMNSTVDGEFQKYATESGAYIREHFFGPDPRLAALVAHLSDEELQSLPRGGHDYRKLYAAYKAATEHVGAPTAILAKTVKGWTLGPEIEARNATHQIKKMTKAQLLALRDRLFLHDEIPERDLDADLPPYYRPEPDEPAAVYLAERRRALGGPLPRRVVRARPSAPRPRRRSPTCWPARAARRSPPPWLSPGCSGRSSGIPSIGRAHRPDRRRRGPHLRPRVAHQRGADLRARRAALHPGRRRPRPPLRRERHRPGAPGGHHRSRSGGRPSPPPRPRTRPGASR